MKFCKSMYLDNRSKTWQFPSHRSKVKVTWLDSLPLWDRAKKVCWYDNSWTAALSLMIFCMNIKLYVDNCTNPIEYEAPVKVQGFFVSGSEFTKWCSSNVEKIVVDSDAFRLSIAWSIPEIFAIKFYSCPKSCSLLITHESLHLASWHYFCTHVYLNNL